MKVEKNKKEAIVFFNGEVNHREDFYKNIDYKNYDIYCADGGANHIYNIDKTIKPELIVGDLDSVSDEVVKHYEELGVKLDRYSPFKDFTDGELVLELVTKKYDRVLVLGGLGGRSDHFLTNLNLLEKYPNARYEDEKEILFFVEKECELENYKGKTISFIPLTNIEKLTLIGFEYPLEKKDFERASSLCTSNVIVENKVLIKYEKGSILGIIQK